MGMESSFPLISGRNPDEMVSMLQINLGENLALERAAKRSDTSGSGYLSFRVMELSHRKSTHNRREPSFFLMKRTGALNGELEGQIKPMLRCSSINSQRAPSSD